MEKYLRLQIQALCSRCKRNTGGRLGNPCCHWNTVRITYSECVSVALVYQHATRIHRTILPTVACLVVPFFLTSFQRSHYISVTSNVFSFPLQFLPPTFLIPRRIQRDIINEYSSVEAPGDAVCCGTALKAGRSRDRFPIVPLALFIDIILPDALWPWGLLIL